MGYVTVQEGYKRTLIIPVETFPSASQTADINECVSYFMESLLASAAPCDSAGKTQNTEQLPEQYSKVLQIGHKGPFQVLAKSPGLQSATLVPTPTSSIIR